MSRYIFRESSVELREDGVVFYCSNFESNSDFSLKNTIHSYVFNKVFLDSQYEMFAIFRTDDIGNFQKLLFNLSNKKRIRNDSIFLKANFKDIIKIFNGNVDFYDFHICIPHDNYTFEQFYNYHCGGVKGFFKRMINLKKRQNYGLLNLHFYLESNLYELYPVNQLTKDKIKYYFKL